MKPPSLSAIPILLSVTAGYHFAHRSLCQVEGLVLSEQSEYRGLERSRRAAFAAQLPEDALKVGAHC